MLLQVKRKLSFDLGDAAVELRHETAIRQAEKRIEAILDRETGIRSSIKRWNTRMLRARNKLKKLNRRLKADGKRMAVALDALNQLKKGGA